MERLVSFLRRLFQERFFGTVVIKVEHGKVTHVEVSTRRSYEYKDLPAEEAIERRNG
jgi:hypothetical protein